LVVLEGFADRGAAGHSLAGLRHERGVPLVVIEHNLDVAGVECVGIAAVEVFGSRYLHRRLLWLPDLASGPPRRSEASELPVGCARISLNAGLSESHDRDTGDPDREAGFQR